MEYSESHMHLSLIYFNLYGLAIAQFQSWLVVIGILHTLKQLELHNWANPH
jgi:hypothetical protein